VTEPIDTERLVRWYDFQAPLYRLWRNRYDGPLVDLVLDRIGNAEVPTRILDAGCGTGLYSIGIGRRRPAWQIDGIDVSRGMLDVAENQARSQSVENVEFHRGSVTELPFADGTFDAVVAAGIIPLINNPVVALGEFHRVLREGGRMISLEFDRNGLRPGTRAFFETMILGFKIVSRLFPRFRYARRWNLRTSTIERAGYEEQLRAAGFDSATVEVRHDHLIYDLVREPSR